MPHILKLKSHESIEDLRQIIKDAEDESYKTRLRAILSIKEGMTHTDAAKLFVVSRTSIIAWVNLYNTGGAPALQMSKGGRPKGCMKWKGAIFGFFKQVCSRQARLITAAC